MFDSFEKYHIFWRRLAASILDSAALAPLNWLGLVIWSQCQSSFILIPWTLFFTVVSATYAVYFVARYGQTPGKMAMAVRVESLSGEIPGLRKSILRDIVAIVLAVLVFVGQSMHILRGQLENHALWSGKQPAGLIMVLIWMALAWSMLEFVTMMTNKKRRAVHDYIAGTVVVRIKDQGQSQQQRLLFWSLVALFILNTVVKVWVKTQT